MSNSKDNLVFVSIQSRKKQSMYAWDSNPAPQERWNVRRRQIHWAMPTHTRITFGVAPYLSGFVCTFHSTAPGSSPEHAFINLSNCVMWKKTKINKKRPGLAHIFLKIEEHLNDVFQVSGTSPSWSRETFTARYTFCRKRGILNCKLSVQRTVK